MSKDLNVDKRVYIIIIGILLLFIIYIAQLFNLQILSSSYKDEARGNAFFKRIIYPQRGIIYDRNGKLIVANQPTYDVAYIPREVQPYDTTYLCNILGITKDDLLQRIKNLKVLPNGRKNPAYSPDVLQILFTQLDDKSAALLQERLYKFPGFFLQRRTLRRYERPNAGLLLGYVAELNGKQIKEDPFYIAGDYGGKSGIEASYETYLRGEKGNEILLRDARGRLKGKYEDGAYDTPPISGRDLTLSLDADLQAYGEKLLENKIGCIVMIEPSTGEILALVSSPSYDPSLLRGRDYAKNYIEISQNPLNPLFNRATQGVYPPGSTFKVPQALVFLQENAINEKVAYPCALGYIPLGRKPKCHPHSSPVSVIPAIATSCNAFFPYGLTNLLTDKKFKDINEAFNVWKDHMVSMGFGYKLNIDIPYEGRGFIPNSEYYAKAYKTQDWKPTYIISTAIGQGEILTTPIQMANFAATVANRGYYYTPHIVKAIQDTVIDERFTKRNYTTIDAKHFDTVAEGMAMSVTNGTSRRANLLPDFQVCGKTGTAENPHGKDHSIFMGFAPKDQPKVAIFAVIENAGFGATFAVPIARLMLQKYLRGEVPASDKYLEDAMLKANLLPKN